VAPLNCDLEILAEDQLCAVLRTPTMSGIREHRILSPERQIGEGIASHADASRKPQLRWPTCSPFLNANLMARPFITPIFCFITTLGGFAACLSCSASPAQRYGKDFAMKPMMMILATAALASTLVTAAAEARASGFGGGGRVGGFGGGAHVGGIVGSAHIGGINGGMHVGGAAVPGGIAHLGGEHLGLGDHVGGHDGGLHQHAMHRFGRYSPGYFYNDGLDCYDWTRLHPGEPLPLSCS
jgi:hypothetical protein